MNDDLQKKWDRFLVEGFYLFPHHNLMYSSRVFMLKNSVTYDQLKSLKRVPKTIHHERVTVSRFVCAFLPTIAKVLWEHSSDEIDKLSEAVSKLKSDARETPVDNDKRRQERNEITQYQNQDLRAKQKKMAMSNLYAKHRRSNQWGVTK